MPSDLFTAYEQGMQHLLDQLGPDHPEWETTLALQVRLLENIARTRQDGDTESNRADRAAVLKQLNNLATAIGAPLLLAIHSTDDLPALDLPLDSVPDVARLPPGSRMLLRPNQQFVGRQAELMALARLLRGGATAAISPTAAATGLGGIGKTQLATEFAHRYGQFFPGGVFWLSMADPKAVASEVVACGLMGGLNLPESFATQPTEAQLSLIRERWQQPIPRLLIFDNCEDPALLEEWRPSTGGCRVLVTSRRSSWDDVSDVESLALHTLPRPRSIELLRKFRPDLPQDDRDLAAIAEELGDLPLALHLAGSFLKQNRGDTSPAEYLQELRQTTIKHESLQGSDVEFSPTKHDLNIGRSIKLSYDQLEAANTTDALALQLLARAAYFAPGEPIGRELLLSTVELPNKTAQRRAGSAIRRLAKLGLLEVEAEEALRLHRLVVAFVRAESPDTEAQATVEEVLIDTGFDLVSKGVPALLRSLEAHLRYVADAARSREDWRASQLCAVMARYLNLIGSYAAGQHYAERALAIEEGRDDPNEQNIATTLSDLAQLVQNQGNYATARPLFERALAIYERVKGSDHSWTATALNNLAELLREQGDYVAARPLYERALAISERVHDPEHPDIAASLNNLALLLHSQGDYAAARSLYERALAISERVNGPEHPSTAVSLWSIGALLRDTGDGDGAREQIQRAVEIFTQSLGASHPRTQNCQRQLDALGPPDLERE